MEYAICWNGRPKMVKDESNVEILPGHDSFSNKVPPPMTDTLTGTPSAQQQIEQNYRWNFTVNALDGASWWSGMSFISSTVILPLYVSHFTHNPLLIGLIPFLSAAGYLLPQLFTANAVERAPKKKFFPVTIGFFLERVPIFLLAPTTYFLAANRAFAPNSFLKG